MPQCYVTKLTAPQVQELHQVLDCKGWEFSVIPYAHWRAKREKVNVTAYLSGKLTVQGKGMDEFIQFILEPEILHQARYGYEKELAAEEKPDMFLPHAGIDESGKGDYFGPLVVACCYTNEDSARALLSAGVVDSKNIGSDKKMESLAKIIRKECAGKYSIITINPETYNRLYGSFRNLNRLLAWGHAKALETMLEKVPDCPRAISDQFNTSNLVQRALMERGRRIKLEQYPRAESDIAVAAASILARAEFVFRMNAMENLHHIVFPKGASKKVLQQATLFVEQNGPEDLGKVAKLHFKTTDQVLGSSL